MKIKYTVIIPHFNDEDGLRRLLSSVPLRSDIEVVVVDDQSYSNVFFEIVDSSGLPNIKAYINDRVKSAGTCRNIGLEHAEGEFLIFADADDVFTEHAFSYFDSAIKCSPTSDIYFFNVDSITEFGSQGIRHLKNRSLVLNYLDNNGPFCEERLKFTHNVPWGKVIRKSLVDENSIFFDQTIIANDGVFSLKVGKAAKKIFASSDIVYCVTSRGNSLTRQKDVNKYRVRLEVYVRYYHLLTDEEKRKINASPVPLLYLSVRYGFIEFFRSIRFFIKNDVNIFKYFRFKKDFASILFK